MEDKKTFHPRFNLFDVVIVALALAVVAGAVFLRNRSTGADTARETVPVRYTIEITRAPWDMAEQMRVGDKAYRSTDSAYLGKIADVRRVPHVENEFLPEEGRFVRYEAEECCDIYLTIEGQAYATAKDIMVESVAPKIGGELFVKGKGFAHMGYVYSIDTMGADFDQFARGGSGSLETTYIIRLEDMREDLLGGVHVGDALYEKVTGALLGTVEEVWTEPYGETHLGADGTAVYAEKEGSYFQYVRVKGNAVDKEDGYYLDGGTELKIGANIVVTSQYLDRQATFYSLLDVTKK